MYHCRTIPDGEFAIGVEPLRRGEYHPENLAHLSAEEGGLDYEMRMVALFEQRDIYDALNWESQGRGHTILITEHLDIEVEERARRWAEKKFNLRSRH